MNNKKVKPDYIKNIIKNIFEKEFRKIYKDFKISKIILQTKEWKSWPFIKVYHDTLYEWQNETIFLSEYKYQRAESNLQQTLFLCASIEDLWKISNRTSRDLKNFIQELKSYNKDK